VLPSAVTPLCDIPLAPMSRLLESHGLQLEVIPPGEPIPGSYWGETEAGLIAHTLYARSDTPVHSVLHEACHYICMDAARRGSLHTDARGDDIEEVAVCYLQALLADRIDGYSRKQLFADMDAWGYNFRLGSTQAWFEQDADDARDWLRRHQLIDETDVPRMRRRER
jgi:hypothetical protein